ncbi:MAG TPA: aminofutalosine synthase MqnE, partial [Bacteroidia bacterium]|nr:aminofutalosine synthase MqnE [Bacteroidia bacterium]
MSPFRPEELLRQSPVSAELKTIAEKVLSGIRITVAEGQALYEQGDLSFLGMLGNFAREQKHG